MTPRPRKGRTPRVPSPPRDDVGPEPGAPALGETIEWRDVVLSRWVLAKVVNHAVDHVIVKAVSEWPRALRYSDEGKTWRRTPPGEETER